MATEVELEAKRALKACGYVLDRRPDQIDKLLLKELADKAPAMQNVWDRRNRGESVASSELYSIPTTLRQAGLLFSYDHVRAAKTMAWLDRVVGASDARSVVELGCGLGALLAFLTARHPAKTFVGIDACLNLVDIDVPAVTKKHLDYLATSPDGQFDLVLCDFGFDHDHAYSEGNYWAAHVQAWTRWASPNGKIAIVGRIPGVADIIFLASVAQNCGWRLDLDASEVLGVVSDGTPEAFPALVFRPGSPAAYPTKNDIEDWHSVWGY